jgi:nucleoside-diphosphate-sugar epimerase
MAKILLAGVAGFKGSRVVKLFAAQGYKKVQVGDLFPIRLSDFNQSARSSGETEI